MSRKKKQKRSKHPTGQEIAIEVGNAVTHGIGALLSIAGLVILIIQAVHKGGAMRIVSFTIFGSVMILFYLASTLFHALVFTRAKHIFQIFDHSMIYILIAACYTPYCLVTIKDWLGWTIFGLEWAIAIAGVVYKSIWLKHPSKWSTLIYVLMGWLCVIAFVPLWHDLGPVGFYLLLAGGIVFTLGTLLYSAPNKYTHLIWHVFVLVGTGLIYFSILLYV